MKITAELDEGQLRDLLEELIHKLEIHSEVRGTSLNISVTLIGADVCRTEVDLAPIINNYLFLNRNNIQQLANPTYT